MHRFFFTKDAKNCRLHYRIVLTQIETKYWPLDNEIDLAKMSKNLMLSEVLESD